VVLRSLPAAVFRAKIAALDVELGVQLQQRLVDAAQLLGAQVLVIHRPQHPVLDGEGQGADGVQQVALAMSASSRCGRGALREQEAAQAGQAQRPDSPSRSSSITSRSAAVQVGVGRRGAAAASSRSRVTL
jgi:hypothetical protein